MRSISLMISFTSSTNCSFVVTSSRNFDSSSRFARFASASNRSAFSLSCRLILRLSCSFFILCLSSMFVFSWSSLASTAPAKAFSFRFSSSVRSFSWTWSFSRIRFCSFSCCSIRADRSRCISNVVAWSPRFSAKFPCVCFSSPRSFCTRSSARCCLSTSFFLLVLSSRRLVISSWPSLLSPSMVSSLAKSSAFPPDSSSADFCRLTFEFSRSSRSFFSVDTAASCVRAIIAPCSTSLLRFAISPFSVDMVDFACDSFSCAVSTIAHALVISVFSSPIVSSSAWLIFSAVSTFSELSTISWFSSRHFRRSRFSDSCDFFTARNSFSYSTRKCSRPLSATSWATTSWNPASNASNRSASISSGSFAFFAAVASSSSSPCSASSPSGGPPSAGGSLSAAIRGRQRLSLLSDIRRRARLYPKSRTMD
mmetsp:Transcript_9055/g.22158  ORF Transcript_9055/g.22158 Transcript_9055/m.22158 type:complete len:424 (-) Transcript_9055:99-1370(-)